MLFEKCDWDPEAGQPALSEAGAGCQNMATVSVGNGKFHLCTKCAALPKFRRYKQMSYKFIVNWTVKVPVSGGA